MARKTEGSPAQRRGPSGRFLSKEESARLARLEARREKARMRREEARRLAVEQEQKRELAKARRRERERERRAEAKRLAEEQARKKEARRRREAAKREAARAEAERAQKLLERKRERERKRRQAAKKKRAVPSKVAEYDRKFEKVKTRYLKLVRKMLNGEPLSFAERAQLDLDTEVVEKRLRRQREAALRRDREPLSALEVRAMLATALQEVKADVTEDGEALGVEVSYRTAINADGTVDAEIWGRYPDADGERDSARMIAMILDAALPDSILGGHDGDLFSLAGLQIRGVAADGYTARGQVTLWTHPTPYRDGEGFNARSLQILGVPGGMTDEIFDQAPNSAVSRARLRLHWTPTGTRPPRPEWI